MTTSACPPQTQSEILGEVEDIVGDVVSALYAVRDLTMWVSDNGSEAYRVGALCSVLAEKLDEAYRLLDRRELLQDLRPAPDAAPQEEGLAE